MKTRRAVALAVALTAGGTLIAATPIHPKFGFPVYTNAPTGKQLTGQHAPAGTPALSPADAQILRETGRKYAADLVKQTRSENEKSYATLAKAGIKTISIPAEEAERIRTTCHEIWSSLAGTLYPKELLDEAVAAAAGK